MADDYTEPVDGLELTPPAQPAAPESDPALQGWEELRRRRKGRDAVPPAPVETQPDPNVGVSPLAQELDREGWFSQLASQNAAEREVERRAAARQSAEAAAQEAARYGGGGPELFPGQAEATQRMFGRLRETPEAAGVAATQIPGGAISSVGSVLQAPDVVASSVQHGEQTTLVRQMEIADRIDRGEAPFPPRPFSLSGLPYPAPLATFASEYRSLSPEDRAQRRAQLQAAITAFNPTPIQQRPLYQAGAAVQEYGRTLIPLPEGYDEQSFSVQVGRGLGSMLAGMPATMLAGPVGGAVVFGSMGMGEATQRAVEFDRRERAAGRPGLAQEQIILAGIAGVAPGTTDVLPVEVLLGRLPLPLPPALRTALARSIARVGGQAIVEGAQEGGQQFLQNLIAWQVYNPDQVLSEEVVPNLLVGGFVGGTAQVGREALAPIMGLGGRRGGRAAPQPGAETTPPQPVAPAAPPEAAEPTPAAQAEPAAPTPDDPFGLGEIARPSPAAPEAAPVVPQAGEAAEAPAVVPEAEAAPAAAPAGPEAAPAPAPERERLTRLPRFEDLTDRLPRDAEGNPDVAGLQQRMQEQYGAGSWGDLNLPQRVELFRQLGVEAREREAAAAARPAALPATPLEPEGQLQEAISRILEDRPEEIAAAQDLAQRFAPTAEALAGQQARAADIERVVAESLPQWRGQFEAALRERGISEADVAALVDESVQLFGSAMQNAGVPATIEALKKYAYEEGQKQALEAVDRQQPGASARAAPEAVTETITGPIPRVAAGAGAGPSPAAGASAAGRGAAGTTAGVPRTEPAAPAAPAAARGPSAVAERTGPQRAGAAPARLGAGRAEPGTPAQAEPVGADERGVRDGGRAAQPVTEPTSAQRQQLRGIIASRFPLNWGTIQARLGTTPEQMEALRQEALNEGLLRQTKDGAYRRTSQAAVTPTGPELSITPEDRVEGSIGALGKQVSPAVRAYAIELLTRLGSPSFVATLNRAKADKGLSAQDVRDLAAIAGDGKPIANRAKKATAFASIEKRNQDHRTFLEKQAVEQEIGVQLASFASANSDGQSQRAEFDALGFYSKALEAAKAWKQKTGTPQQALQHLLKAGSGVKNELEAIGLNAFLEGKKSISRDDLVSFLRENRVEVREATYPSIDPTQADNIAQFAFGRPFSQLTLAERAQITTDIRVSGQGRVAKWRSHSLAKDDGNPSYRETVLHLPARNARYLQLEAELEPRITELLRLGRDEEANALEAQVERAARLEDDSNFQSGHFPEPNVVSNIMSSINKLGGETTSAISQIQSDWSQEIRDRTRDAVARQLFDPSKPEVKARIAELRKRIKSTDQERNAYLLGEPLAFLRGLEVANDVANPSADNVAGALAQIERGAIDDVSDVDRQRAGAFLDDPRNAGFFAIGLEVTVLESSDKRFRELPDNMKAEVSAAISEARQRGELPAGARDERKIADLEKQREALQADIDAYRDRVESNDPSFASGVQPLLSARDLIEAELKTAKAAAPSHPFVNTTDAWLTFTLKHVVNQAIAAGADSISMPSGKTVLSYNPGDESGMEEFYDSIVPKALAKILTELDKSVKPQKVATVQSPVDGRELGKGFTVFPITAKVRERVALGQSLFALGPTEQGRQPPPYTDAFAASLPELRVQVERRTREMLPPEIAARVVDRIVIGTQTAYANYGFTENPAGIFNRVVQIALTTDLGASSYRTMLVKGFHEVVHALREYGRLPGGIYGTLLTDQEWQVAVERAKKIGIDDQITVFDHSTGKTIPGIPVYRRFYRDMLRANGYTGEALNQRVEELIDQERVARAAELWAEGTSFGAKIDSFFERLVKFVEAVRNALRGLGFQTYDDVFRSMASGEVARRPEGGRREPTFDPFPNTPTPPQAHLFSEEGQEARGLFPAIRAFSGYRADLADAFRSLLGVGNAASPEAQSYRSGVNAEPLANLGESRAAVDQNLGVTEGPAGAPLRRIDPASLKNQVDRLVGDAILLADASERPALLEQGLSGFEVPAKRAVFHAVSRVLKNRKVLDAVVASVPIDVVNVLAGRELAPEVLLHDVPMFLDLLASNGNQPVAVGVNAASALMRVVAATTAKEALVTGDDAGRLFSERAAVFARDMSHEDIIGALTSAAKFDDSFSTIVVAPVASEERADVLQQMHQEQEGGQSLAAFSDDRAPARTGKYGSLPEEAAFRKLMGRQYEIAKASGDLSTQYDILSGRLNNDRSMPPAMREAMELERVRIAREMGPDGRAAAGIPDPDVIEGPGELASFASDRPAPESRPFSIPGFDGTVTEKVKEGGERLRTYSVAEASASQAGPLEPAAASATGGTSLIVSEQPDGSWELTFFKAEDASTIPAIVAAIEQDIGKPISPRGWLTPQGFRYWQQVSPESVKFHVNASEMFGGMYASPRAIEFAEAVLVDVQSREAEALSGFDTSTIYYHGTTEVFNEFKKDKIGKRSQSWLGRGFYFSSSPEVASGYAGVQSWSTSGVRDFELLAPDVIGANVRPVYLRMRKPLILSRMSELPDRFGISRDGDFDDMLRAVNEEVDRRVASGEFDSIKFVLENGEVSEAVVFDPSNIRSATAGSDPTAREASSHLSRLKSSIPQEAFTEARREERFSLAASPTERRILGKYDVSVEPDAGGLNYRVQGIPGARYATVFRIYPVEGKNEYELVQASVDPPGQGIGRALALFIARDILPAKLVPTTPQFMNEASHALWRSIKNDVDAIHQQGSQGPSQEGSPVLLAALQGAPPGTPPAGPQLPTTPASQGEVRGLADIISDLKSALGMTVTQGLYGMRVRDRAGGRTWGFRPQRSVRSQYDANAGVARIRVATDIDAIAREGGRHVERVFGARMQAFLNTHAEELAVPAAPDTPLPPLNPTGYSGLELDADTQRVLVDAATNYRAWQAAPTGNQVARYEANKQAAIPVALLRRRLGRTIADALVGDLVRQTGGNDADYVRERYSTTGTPQPRVAPTPSQAEISNAFAEFFRQYITYPDTAKRDQPGVYTSFEDFLDANDPAMLQDLERVQLEVVSADYKAYREATAVERGVADVATMQPENIGERLADWYQTGRTWGGRWDLFKNWISSVGSSLSYEMTDRTNPILKTQQALLRVADTNGVRDIDGRPISLQPSENAHRISRMQAGADKIAHQIVTHGVPDYQGLEPIGPALQEALVLALGGTRAFQWSDKAIRRFGLYLEARRAVAEWPRFVAGEIGQPTRRDLTENQRIIAELEAANPNYRQAAQMVYDWQHRLLTLEYQAGKWDKASYDELTKRKDAYVPFMRDLSDLVPMAGAPPGTRMARRFTEGKRFQGSQRDIINPIESLIKRAHETAAAIQFNDMVKALANLSDRAGSGGAGFVERVQKEEALAANQRTFERIKEEAIRLGIDPADAHIIVQKMELNFTDANVQVLWDPDNLGPQRPPIIPLWENGERKLVRLNDPVMGRRLFDAMNALGREQTNIWIRAIGYPAAVLRAGVTMHPAFVISNVLADLQAAWTLTGAPPVITQAKGLYYLLATNPAVNAIMRTVGITPPKLANLYATVGGIAGGQNVAAIRAVSQEYDLHSLRLKGYRVLNLPALGGLGLVGAGVAAGGVIAGPVGATIGASAGAMAARVLFGQGAERAFAQLSELSETITRLGVAAHAAKRARKLYPNMSDIDVIREAAFTARDVIDFDRAGAKAGTLLKLIPFLNSNLQGVSKAYRQALLMDGDRGRVNMEKVRLFLRWQLTGTGTFKQEVSPRDQQAIRDGARLWVNMMIMAAAGTAIAFLFSDEPEYDDVRKEVRNTHYVFKLWGTWYRIKKPFELAQLANMSEAFYEWMFRNDPRLMGRIWESFRETHMPPIMPQGYNLVTGWWTGIDAGRPGSRAPRPIVPEGLSRLPASEQYNAYTSAFALAWSRALQNVGINISPMMIDWTLNNELAYWGREVRVTSDYFFSERAPQWTDTPIVGTMLNRFTHDPSRSSESIQEFWALMGRGRGEFDEAYAGYDAILKRGNSNAATAYLAGLSPEERTYAVLQRHFRGADQSAHPLNRANIIYRVDSGMRREMAEPGGLISTDPANRGESIPLAPAQRAQIDNILGRLSAIEAWNALHAIGRPGWGEREVRDPQPVLDELRAASEPAYEEMMRRRRHPQSVGLQGRVGTFEEDMARWREVEERVNTMIRDENLLGTAWERTFRRRRAPTRKMQQPEAVP